MSDWLERELARELAPVVAPDALKTRLGFAPPKRWEFPRVLLAVAAAVVVIMGGAYAASRTPTLDLTARQRASYDAQTIAGSGDARLIRCDGGASMPQQVTAGKATVLVAHAASPVPGLPAHARPPATDAGCQLCHSL